jgi:heme/copper-type cytochrome/quinol oxidase subunit 2
MSRATRNQLVSNASALALALLLTGVAAACPTCKDNLAHDPAGANLARGYAYSILFMLSMPPLIFGILTAYFYWEVRRARARLAALQAESTSTA